MSNEIIDINEYKEILSSIKNEILKSQHRAMQVVNVEMIYMYWKVIFNNIKCGNKFVDNLAIDLKFEFPNITEFSPRNIRYMRKFADEYQEEKFLQELLTKVTWYHNVILMDKVKDIEERKWYIRQIIKNGWSTNILKNQIKNKLYEIQAIADKTTDFKNILPDIQSDLALQTLKDPYIFDFIALKG